MTWPTRWIDAHIHLLADTPEVLGLLRGANVRLINICLSFGKVQEALRQHELNSGLAERNPDCFAFIGTFPWNHFDRAHYPQQVREVVDDAFQRGAVGIKVWKDIGMECRDAAGKWVQADHPAFQPVWDLLVELGLPLVAHLGEPLDAWSPLRPSSPHFSYYSTNAQWHWHGRNDVPTHEEIMAARDRMMERNPRLRVVGCHLASLERDVDVLAKSLDRFPQLAVDTGGRMNDLLIQDRDKVREFLIKYQDRVLYGSDFTWGLFTPGKELEPYLRHMASLWQRDLKWLGSDNIVTWDNRSFRGLALPKSVLNKVLYSNALNWYPRVAIASTGAPAVSWTFSPNLKGDRYQPSAFSVRVRRALMNPRKTVFGVKTRAEAKWRKWEQANSREKCRSHFNRWLSTIQSHPPDVLMGANAVRSAGLRHHLCAIQRYSLLRVELAPPDRLLRTAPTDYLTTNFRDEFLKFNPKGICAVHSHVEPWFIEWCRIQKEAGLRWIHTYHNMYFPEFAKGDLEPWQKKVNDSLINGARHADVRISVSRWQKRWLVENCGIETDYIPNGVDVALCDNADPNRFHSKTRICAPFILYVGRNQPVKNPADFVHLSQRLPNHTFVMIGQELTPEALQAEWAVTVPANLYVLGEASHGEVLDAIAACSVLVVTSKREGLPTLVLEAMTMSKPVVVPEEAGCLEAINGGEFGFTYIQGHIDNLADMTLQALGDNKRMERARAHVLSEYDWRAVAPKLDALYLGKRQEC